MNKDAEHSSYYENTIKFFGFSDRHRKWSQEINRQGINDITDYYKNVKEWYSKVN